MSRQTTKHRTSCGFTLVEFIMVLVIAAMLAVMSVPMSHMLESNRASEVAYEFMATLNFARSEAIKRGNRITVCRTMAGNRCDEIADINKQKVWDAGWMVFSDINGNGQFNTGQDEILRVHGALPNGYTLRSNSRVRVTYKATGISPGFMDSWTVCAPGSGMAKGIIIAYSGRVRFARDTNGNGTIDNGTPAMRGKPRELRCNT